MTHALSPHLDKDAVVNIKVVDRRQREMQTYLDKAHERGRSPSRDNQGSKWKKRADGFFFMFLLVQRERKPFTNGEVSWLVATSSVPSGPCISGQTNFAIATKGSRLVKVACKLPQNNEERSAICVNHPSRNSRAKKNTIYLRARKAIVLATELDGDSVDLGINISPYGAEA